jgi:hypothetical protein
VLQGTLEIERTPRSKIIENGKVPRKARTLKRRARDTRPKGQDTRERNPGVTETLMGRGGDTLQGCAHNPGLPSGAPVKRGQPHPRGAPRKRAARKQGERHKGRSPQVSGHDAERQRWGAGCTYASRRAPGQSALRRPALGETR